MVYKSRGENPVGRVWNGVCRIPSRSHMNMGHSERAYMRGMFRIHMDRGGCNPLKGRRGVGGNVGRLYRRNILAELGRFSSRGKAARGHRGV